MEKENNLKKDLKLQINREEQSMLVMIDKIQKEEVCVDDFTEEELNRIIKYLEKSINDKEEKLERIKNRIIALK